MAWYVGYILFIFFQIQIHLTQHNLLKKIVFCHCSAMLPFFHKLSVQTCIISSCIPLCFIDLGPVPHFLNHGNSVSLCIQQSNFPTLSFFRSILALSVFSSSLSYWKICSTISQGDYKLLNFFIVLFILLQNIWRLLVIEFCKFYKLQKKYK